MATTGCPAESGTKFYKPLYRVYINNLFYTGLVIMMELLAVRLATGWTVWGSNPSGGEIFCTCLDWPWGPPSLLYNGYQVFPRGKERLRRDADPSPPSSAVVKKE